MIRLYSCADTGELRKSIDGGQTWLPTSAPTSINWNKVLISPFNPDHLLAGGENYYYQSKLFKSTNGGSSWTDLTSLGSPGGDNAVYGIAVDPADESRIHLGMENNTALSVNGGASWNFQVFPGSTGFPYSFDVVVDPLQPSRVFYLAYAVWAGTSPLHLAISQDRGESWTLLNHDPGYGYGEAYDLELVSENEGTSAYFAGRGVHRIGSFPVSSSPEAVPGASTITLSPAYERNGRIVIPYSVPDGGATVSLVIFDVLGRPLRRFPVVTRAPGVYETEWSGDDDRGLLLAAGIYFARLTTPGISLSRKITWGGK